MYAERFWEEKYQHIALSKPEFVETFMRLDGNGYVPRETFFYNMAGLIKSPQITVEVIHDFFYSEIDGAWSQPLLFESALDGLAMLKQGGILTGVISNGGTQNQSTKIENADLRPYLDHVLISEEFGAKKPNPAIFNAMLGQLNVSAQDAWFVGDHPVFDICAAHAVGMRTIWIERALQWPEKVDFCFDYRVDKLGKAFEILRNQIA